MKQKLIRFFFVGVTLTLFDYVIYTVIVMIFFRGNTDRTDIASLIAGFLATFLAYTLHSRITWKDRNAGKIEAAKFFAWNIALALVVRPILTWIFRGLDPLYEFALMICHWIHLPFSFEFVKSTGIFVLMTLIVMVLNFLVYEKLVFGSKK